MDCAEEVSLLRRTLSQRHGIRDLSFDVLEARMAVEYDASAISSGGIETAVAGLGMRAEPWTAQGSPAAGFWATQGRRAAAWTSGIFLLAATLYRVVYSGQRLEAVLAPGGAETGLPAVVRTLYVLAAVAGSVFSAPKAWSSVRRLRPDMNTLVLFSVIGAMALGEWSEGATLAFLFSFAGLLEDWSIGRARQAVANLVQVTPQFATVVHRHGDVEHELQRPARDVPAGSIVRIKPGESVAFDGTVVRGVSSVNQALITGESIAIEKNPGDLVYAGTLNEEGILDIRTTLPAQETVLARMTRMVGNSRARRAPSEQMVERFARYYTPAVFLAAFAVMAAPTLFFGGAWSRWFYQGMVVLLIACPCALVISTPVSVAAALACAARRGVLIKGGAFLEEAAGVAAIAFSKTGVLTTGQAEVHALIPLGSRSGKEILHHLAALESFSEHPMAQALLRYARTQGIEPETSSAFRTVAGFGVEAAVGGKPFWAGNRRMRDGRIASGPAAEEMHDGRTVVTCGDGDGAWARLIFDDPPRPELGEAIRGLRRLGVARCVLLTGDSAALDGLDEAHTELASEGKAAAVAELKQRYQRVAMVGDGASDAEALAAATLGISFGHRHTGAANENADIVVTSTDLRELVFLRRHAQRTLRVIRENLVIALACKAAFLAMALRGEATLWMAVLADMGATLIVIFNGLRLLASPAHVWPEPQRKAPKERK
jgi:Zn2+/Cd2+-exporting ATPase